MSDFTPLAYPEGVVEPRAVNIALFPPFGSLAFVVPVVSRLFRSVEAALRAASQELSQTAGLCIVATILQLEVG